MGVWTCTIYGTCSGQQSPCTTNLTVWNPVNLIATDLRNNTFYGQIRTAINSERTRRGLTQTTFSSGLNTNAIEAFLFITELKNSIDGIKLQSWTNSYINSSSVTSVRAHLIELRSKINTLEYECLCNCNYCTCQCNYCTCNCDYCTCNCDYCACKCAYR